MISIGDELARLLEETGIRVIHDRTFHDHPSYNSSYSNARRSIDSYLQQYPSIRMVLDIHRDAAQTSYGQLVTSATVGGQRSAQLMMVVGTDASGNYHPEWEENLALALKLSAVLEQTDPGITRPVNIRKERFNMDKTAGSLLIEVGAAGNTHQEAMIAVHALARGITALAQGAQ
jgi:stage II sporulation protein P